MSKKKIRIGRTQGYILDAFIKDNLETLNKKKPEKIARVCGTALGFEISPSTIVSIRRAMVAAGLDVWEEAPRSKENKGLFTKLAALEKQMEVQLAEQDKKFKIVFEKLRDLALFQASFKTPLDPPSYSCEQREILRDMSDEKIVTEEEMESWQ